MSFGSADLSGRTAEAYKPVTVRFSKLIAAGGGCVAQLAARK